MDVDGASTSAAAIEAREVPIRSVRSDKCHELFHQFKQQRLQACRPVLTPAWVITTYLLMGAIFIPIGLVTLHFLRGVVELVDRYDIECVPDVFKSDKLGYIKDSSIPKNCSRFLKERRQRMRIPMPI